jgi:hypothetical protein
MSDPTDWLRRNAPHRIYVLWLRAFYWPFWHGINRLRRAWSAMHTGINLVSDAELFTLTALLDEHPDDWKHPCACAECLRNSADE